MKEKPLVIYRAPKERLLFGEMFQLNLLIMLSVSTDLVCKTPFFGCELFTPPNRKPPPPGKKEQKCFRTI